MARWLVLGAILWPLILGAAVAARVHDPASVVARVIYDVGARICHQRPERSFHTSDIAWPVCARCAGLYLAAPFGALFAMGVARTRTLQRRQALRALAVAAIPTLVTLLIEWPGFAPTSNLVRFLTALPLGATIAWVLVRTART